MVGRNGGSGKLSVDACTCTCTRVSNVALMLMCMTLPIVVGGWSMAVLLRQLSLLV